MNHHNNNNNYNIFDTNNNLEAPHKRALHCLYTIIKRECTELAQAQLLQATVAPAVLAHPFVHVSIDGNDMFTVHMVLWTAMHMASGIADAINADTTSLYACGESQGYARAMFGDLPMSSSSSMIVSRDMVMERVKQIHDAIA
jgi:hypothetical protein